MNSRKALTTAVIAAASLIGFDLTGVAQELSDDAIEVDAHVSPDEQPEPEQTMQDFFKMSTDVARQELQAKREAIELQMEEVERHAKEIGNHGDRRQLEIAREQLELQMKQLELQRAALEHARVDATKKQGQSLRDQIRNATRQLRQAKDGESRAEVIDHIELLLQQFFDRDMDRRQVELTKIENRLEKLRAQLARRREKKQEIVDLQLKVVLNEADGLGFYGQPRDPTFNFRGATTVVGSPFDYGSEPPTLPVVAL